MTMAEPVNLDARRGWVELCGRCGHRLDHLHKECIHPITLRRKLSDEQKQALGTTEEFEYIEQQCGCPDGIRADVLQCSQLAQVIQQNTRILNSLDAIAEILLMGSGLEVTPEGQLRPKSGIITPV
jgi:hypothetical protein